MLNNIFFNIYFFVSVFRIIQNWWNSDGHIQSESADYTKCCNEPWNVQAMMAYKHFIFNQKQQNNSKTLFIWNYYYDFYIFYGLIFFFPSKLPPHTHTHYLIFQKHTHKQFHHQFGIHIIIITTPHLYKPRLSRIIFSNKTK